MAGLLAQAYTESATSRLHSVFMQIPSLYSGGTAGASTPFPWHGQPILRTREGVVKSILWCILLLTVSNMKTPTHTANEIFQ